MFLYFSIFEDLDVLILFSAVKWMLFDVVMQHYFEMKDGVIHVYPNKDCKWLRDFVVTFCNVPFELWFLCKFAYYLQQKKSFFLLQMQLPFSLTSIIYFES